MAIELSFVSGRAYLIAIARRSAMCARPSVTVLRCWMIGWQARLPAEQFLSHCPGTISGLIGASLQLGNQQLDQIRKCTWRDRIGQVEAIDIRFVDPFLQGIGHSLRRSGNQGTISANAAEFRYLSNCPDALGISRAEGIYDRLHCIAFDVAQLLPCRILAEVDSPSTPTSG